MLVEVDECDERMYNNDYNNENCLTQS